MTDKKYTASVYTLGCKVNQYESEAIAERLEALGVLVLPCGEMCDAYVINTCTVTAESDRKARQFIRRAIQKNPDAVIVVCGCYSQTSPEKIAEIEGVDYVLGNSDKLSAADAVLSLLENGKRGAAVIATSPIENAQFEEMRICKFGRTRAYLKIEDGCESRCTYCIIPSARGRIRSKPQDLVLEEVRALIAGGCPEIVLTGIETASYGKDLEGTDLATLLCEVDKLAPHTRIRLGSLDPSLITPVFVDKISGLKSLAPHFHLSLQSGSSRVLANMKRKYNRDMAMSAIKILREKIPEVKFTTDVIVGFPGESDEDFEETMAFAREAGFLMIHVFPYSKRAGTPAAAMKGQIPSDIKKARSDSLISLAASTRAQILESAVADGRVREVLFESYSDGVAVGHTPDFLEVAVTSDRPLHAEFHKVRLISTDGTLCFGEILE